MDPYSGVITVLNPAVLDFESVQTFTFTVRVSDGLFSSDAHITINVADVNEAPALKGVDMQLSNLDNGDVIHIAVADDPDAGDVIVYSLTSNDEYPVFTIDSQTGEITINGIEELLPGVRSYELVVTATDAGGLSAQALIILDIEKKAIAPKKGFSPNGDEQNDFWQIDGIEGFPANAVRIFNRWGHMIAEISGYDNNEHVWTGEGTQVGAGIESSYFFIISVEKLHPVTGYVIVKP
jgi:gliding motility-associated-like protein